MTQNTDVTLAAGWTQLTDGAVTTAVTFQNKTADVVYIKATSSLSTPTTLLGAIRYEPWMGFTGKTISELFPGISGANRLYAYSENGGKAMFSNA